MIEYIIKNGETSRVSLAGALGLSTATVTNIVTELLEQKLLYESRQEHSTAGRKTTLLQFNADLCRVAAVEITSSKQVKFKVCDLLGTVFSTETVNEDLTVSAEQSESAVLKKLIELTKGFLDLQPAETRGAIRAVGLCVGGMVNAKQTVDLLIANWKNLNLVMPMQVALQLPVYAEGITRMKALYEMRYIDESEKNVLYLNLSTGIGMVHFFNRKMVMGKTGIAGEAGHISLNLHGPRCYCGNRGCFEYYCGMSMMLSRAEDLLTEENRGDVFYDLVVNHHEPLTPELLFRAREMGSLVIHELLSNVAEYLGAAIATLYNIYDPDRMIISGYHSCDSFLLENAKIEAKSRIVNRFSREISITRAYLSNEDTHQAICNYVLTKMLDQQFQ